MRVHLVDGTYELFRHFFGSPPSTNDEGVEVAAARGVVSSVAGMILSGTTHVGVATDHVIESFRNDLYQGYKTGEGMDPEILGQFGLLEEALETLGVKLWAMVELEADDALASAAAVAHDDTSVEQVVICTPDKDLAQSVIGERVVQLDRRRDIVTDAAGVKAKYGVEPASIPDWLALVGDSADGFPGLKGWGKTSAARVLEHYGTIEAIPDSVADWDPAVRKAVRGTDRLAETLASQRELADLFKVLATLRVDRSLLSGGVAELEWRGPTEDFPEMCRFLGLPRLPEQLAAHP